MKTVYWYFDYISPFAYLQSHRLEDFTEYALVRCKPVLFGALLAHHGHKGPAEIAAKRGWTYEHALWLAQRNNVPMRLPAAHPFNPLPLLRLAIACDCAPDAVHRIFRFVWRDGRLPDLPIEWHELTHDLGLPDADARIASYGPCRACGASHDGATDSSVAGSIPNSGGKGQPHTLSFDIDARLSRLMSLPGRCSSANACSVASGPRSGTMGRTVPDVSAAKRTSSRSV